MTDLELQTAQDSHHIASSGRKLRSQSETLYCSPLKLPPPSRLPGRQPRALLSRSAGPAEQPVPPGEWAGRERERGGWGQRTKITGLQEKGGRPGAPMAQQLPAGPAAGIPLMAAGAGADDADARLLFLSFSLLSLNAKQINPPPSAESFPLVPSVSLILCSWKLHYSDRSKSLLCGCYKTPLWLLKTASSAPRCSLSEPRTPGWAGTPGRGGKAAAPRPSRRAGEPLPVSWAGAMTQDPSSAPWTGGRVPRLPFSPSGARSCPGRGVRRLRRGRAR